MTDNSQKTLATVYTKDKFKVSLSNNNNLTNHIHQNTKKADKLNKTYLLNFEKTDEEIESIINLEKEKKGDECVDIDFILYRVLDILSKRLKTSILENDNKSLSKVYKNLFNTSYNYNKFITSLIKGIDKNIDETHQHNFDKNVSSLINNLNDLFESEPDVNQISYYETKDKVAKDTSKKVKDNTNDVAYTVSMCNELFSARTKYKLYNLDQSPKSLKQRTNKYFLEELKKKHREAFDEANKAKKDDEKPLFEEYSDYEDRRYISLKKTLLYYIILAVVISKHDKLFYNKCKETANDNIKKITELLKALFQDNKSTKPTEVNRLVDGYFDGFQLKEFEAHLTQMLNKTEFHIEGLENGTVTVNDIKSYEDSLKLNYKKIYNYDHDEQDEEDEDYTIESDDDSDDDSNESDNDSDSDSDNDDDEHVVTTTLKEVKQQKAKKVDEQALEQKRLKQEEALEKRIAKKTEQLKLESKQYSNLLDIFKHVSSSKHTRELSDTLKDSKALFNRVLKRYVLLLKRNVDLKYDENHANTIKNIELLNTIKLSEVLQMYKMVTGSKNNDFLSEICNYMRDVLEKYRYRLKQVLDGILRKPTDSFSNRSKQDTTIINEDMINYIIVNPKTTKTTKKSILDSELSYGNFVCNLVSPLVTEFTLTNKISSDETCLVLNKLYIGQLSNVLIKYMVKCSPRRTNSLFDLVRPRHNNQQNTPSTENKSYNAIYDEVYSLNESLRFTEKKTKKSGEKGTKTDKNNKDKKERKLTPQGIGNILHKVLSSNDGDCNLSVVTDFLKEKVNKITTVISLKEENMIKTKLSDAMELCKSSSILDNHIDSFVTNDRQFVGMYKAKPTSSTNECFLSKVVMLALYMANIHYNLITYNVNKMYGIDNKHLMTASHVCNKYSFKPTQDMINIKNVIDALRTTIINSNKNIPGLNKLTKTVFETFMRKTKDNKQDEQSSSSSDTTKSSKKTKSQEAEKVINSLYKGEPIDDICKFIVDSKKYLESSHDVYSKKYSESSRDTQSGVLNNPIRNETEYAYVNSCIEELSYVTNYIHAKRDYSALTDNSFISDKNTGLVTGFIDLEFGIDQDTFSLLKKTLVSLTSSIAFRSHRLVNNKANTKKKTSISDNVIKDVVDVLLIGQIK